MSAAWIEAINGWATLWGDAMLRAAWQGGLVLALVAVIGRVLPKRSAGLRCWLWRLAYLKLLVALVWVTPVDLPVLPARGPTAETSTAPTLPGQGVERRALSVKGDGSLPGVAGTPLTAPTVGVTPEVAAAMPAPTPLRPAVAPVVWLLLAWLLGAGWCLVRLAREVWSARRMRAECAEHRNPELIPAFAELCWRYALRRAPRLLAAEGYGSPLLLGGASPAIILPAALAGQCSLAEQRLILAHELAHLKRNDLLWGWLPAVAHALFFFHPLVWLANREAHVAQEMACDELALVMTEAPAADYGQLLVKVAVQSRLNLQQGLATVGVEDSPQTLKRRLDAMKFVRGLAGSRLLASHAAATLLAVLVMVPWRMVERPATAASRTSATGVPGGSAVPDAPGVSGPSGVPAASLAAPGTPDGQASALPGLPLAVGTKPGAPNVTPHGVAPAANVALPKVLRYGWTPGRAYAYRLKIEADQGEWTDELGGHLVYQPRAAEGGVTLGYHASFFPMRRPKQGLGIPRPLGFDGIGGYRLGPPAFGNEITVDAFGRAVSQRGEQPLPFALGEMARLMVEPLSPEGKAKWETSGETRINPEGAARGMPGFPDDFPRIPRGDALGGFGRNAPRATLVATERASYTLGAAQGTVVPIRKQYELASRERVGDSPRVQLSGTAEIAFDAVAGVPRGMEFRGTLTESVGNMVRRTPVTVTCTLQEGEPGAPAKPVERQTATVEEATRLLQDLRSPDSFRRLNAANRLTQLAPNGPRAEIAQALEELTRDQGLFARAAAARALGPWGTRDSVNAIIPLLEDKEHAVRWAALEVLGQIKDARAAAPVARLLKRDLHFASRSLQAMGPGAAAAVVPYLKDPEWTVRLEACRVLKAQGGPEQAAALQPVASDENGIVARTAQDALETIAKRR